MLDESRSRVELPSPASSVRKFTVRDVMILVAATALGAWGYRSNQISLREAGFFWGNGCDGWAILVGPGLAALSAALVITRLLAPRPPRVELFQQPGFVAACVALALSARRFLEALSENWVDPYDDWLLIEEWIDALKEVSLGIVVAWSVLALAGRLKAERGWIDRASRAVALIWILSGILCRVLPVFAWISIRNAENLP